MFSTHGHSDYWVALHIMLRDCDMDFDDAQDWLDAFSLSNNSKNNDLKVIFIKTINPKYGNLESRRFHDVAKKL